MKAVSLVTRRAGLDRAGFRDYYETRHCWLAMQHFPFLGYTRNHLLDHPELDFDCISEFEAPEQMAKIDVMASRSRQLVSADELQFMDPQRIRIASVRPHTLIAATDASTGQALHSHVLLLEQEQDQLLERLRQLARNLAGKADAPCAMRLDLLDNDPRCPLPCNALLWLDWLDQDVILPAALEQLPGYKVALRIERCSTPLAELQDRFVAFQP
ncbi:EthD domain-containing protein [Halopseudomonas xiamenensis]|uniref:EthD domain-containing protein n=1 Tax=Halopseudomonas xiamenensis TaxID=157792 RepID=UPI001629C099|nr:EthD domain-containing protein [Halopseudomonas xiamenensis]